MILSDFKNVWDSIGSVHDCEAQRRIDNTHPLNLYYGYDVTGNKEFVLITNIEPSLSIQSSSILIKTGRRHDNRYAICFSLTHSDHEEVFVQLCWDLYEYTKNAISESSGILLLQKRFRMWQKLLISRTEKTMSTSAIRGLLGELIFLQEVAFQKYGPEKAIAGWIGPNGADKDFVYDDNWYEVKSIEPSASRIIISSLEQLDSDADGCLVTVEIVNTSSTDSDAFSLNSRVKDIKDTVAVQPDLLLAFFDKLLAAGYNETSEYDKYFFVFNGILYYKVDSTFPVIERKSLNPAIIEASYSLSIAAINRWLVL